MATTRIVPEEGASETEFLECLKVRAQQVYQRTMALPSGQAVMRFCCTRPVLTEKVRISTFNTTCSMQPSNNSVSADKSNFTEEKVGWAFFHAGVNAGLQISRDSPDIDNSWLVLNKPSELGNRHAGLLLALGLNGHLKKMAKWLAFKYLTAKHAMTSVGLLIGLAASNIGTMDSLITRLLSIHVSRLLPPGAAELDLSPLTQTAGIVGVGLLYYNTQHRRMSEAMLSELEHLDPNDSAAGVDDSFRDESYRLAAAFALGMINLGKGADLRAIHDLRAVERLLSVATGGRETDTVHVLDQAAAGATLAVAMIFMKTHDKSIAQKIDVPSTIHQYDSVRPDILLLRTLARWLIMWDDIRPDVEWVKANSPRHWHRMHTLNGIDDSVFDSANIPFYNIVAGLCWAIALRYAGSGSEGAVLALRHYFLLVSAMLDIKLDKDTFDRSLTRDTLLRWQHVLVLSMAIVCAGRGTLDVLRDLRTMNATVVNKTFGMHQATHMAIGMLFMGNGRLTFSTSNLSIASLLISTYPIFPKDILDNRAHLQALRHFWVFAAETRCLILRDADTQEPLALPITVRLREHARADGNDSLEMHAPCMLPEITKIKSIQIESWDHKPSILDLDVESPEMETFRLLKTIFIEPRNPLSREVGGLERALARGHGAEQRLEGSCLDKVCDWMADLPALRDLSTAQDLAGAALPRSQSKRSGRGEHILEARMHSLLDTDPTTVDEALMLRARAGHDALLHMNASAGGPNAAYERAAATIADASDWLRNDWRLPLEIEVLTKVVDATREPS